MKKFRSDALHFSSLLFTSTQRGILLARTIVTQDVLSCSPPSKKKKAKPTMHRFKSRWSLLLSAVRPSPELLHPPRSGRREAAGCGAGGKGGGGGRGGCGVGGVYQIFLSSFTLNCLWVEFPAPVGPLLIHHRSLCLSVTDPPPHP